MSEIQDLIDNSSIGTLAQLEAGVIPRTAFGDVNLGEVKRVTAGTWLEGLVDAVYECGFGDGIQYATPREGDE